MRAGADAQRGRQYWQRPPQRRWLMPRWAKSGMPTMARVNIVG
jgi:hypothetical protein